MTLSDLANFVCGKVNQSEAEDITACKGFFQRRFKLLWAHALWKDALVSYTQTISPTGYTPASTWLPTKGILLLPPMIERVIAVRSDTRRLNVQRPEYYYRIDFDAFSKSGLPSEFLVLPACVWEFDTAESLLLRRGDAADAASVVNTDTLDDDLVDVTRNSTALAAEYNDLVETERLDVVLKQVTTGEVAVSASESGTITLVNDKSSQAAVLIGDDPALADGNTEYLLAPGESVEVDPALYIGEQLAVPVRTIPGGLGFRGTITVTALNTFTFSSDIEDVVTIAAADTSAKLRQRIRLVQIPDASLTLRVLGKRLPPAFSNDLDQPGLTGVENCLLAFAQGDMLQRERHYAKAQALYQEATVLLEQLKGEEMVQQAHEQRIIPEGGYGSEEWQRLYGFSF